MKKERKHARRFLSILLATVILLISFPTAVWAEMIAEADTEASLVKESGNLQASSFEEDVTLRDKFSKHYRLESGEMFAVVFPEAVHYEDGGEWKEVDNRLTYKNGKYVSANPKFTTAFAENASSSELVSISDGEYTVSWGISFGKKVGGNTVKVQASSAPAAVTNGADVSEKLSSLRSEKSRSADIASLGTASGSSEAEYKNTVTDLGKAASGISYENAMEGAVSLRYSVMHQKVEEDIILRSKSDFTSYTLNVNAGGLTVAAESDGSVTFKNAAGETVFIIKAPWMKDSAYGFSKDIEVTVAQRGNSATVTYTPSADWLSSPDRVYPVLIDPSVTTDGYFSSFIDTYILSGETDYTYRDEDQSLYVGRCSFGEWYAYIKLLELPDFEGRNVRITNGELIMYSSSSYSANYPTSFPLRLNEVTSRWTGQINIPRPSSKNISYDVSATLDFVEDNVKEKYVFDLSPFFNYVYSQYGSHDNYWSNNHYGFELESVLIAPDTVTFLHSAQAASYCPMMTFTYIYLDNIIQDGVYNLKTSTSKYMAVNNINNEAETEVILSSNLSSDDNNDSIIKFFRFERNGTANSYVIKTLVGADSKILGIDSSSLQSNGTYKIKLYDDDTENCTAMQWVLVPLNNNMYRVVFKNDETLALNHNFLLNKVNVAKIKNNTDSTNLGIPVTHPDPSQQWILETGGVVPLWGSDFLDNESENLVRGEGIQFTIPPAQTTESKVVFFSDDGSIAYIDSTGYLTATGIGSTTIHWQEKIGKTLVVSTKSMEINVTSLNETEYFLKNRDSKELLRHSLGTTTALEQENYDGETDQKWILSYSNGYYHIQNAYTSRYLTAPNSTMEGSAVTCQSYNYNIADRQFWKITRIWGEVYKIQSKAHEGTNLVLAYSGNNIVIKNYTDNDDYKDEWLLCHKVHNINNYYDMGYIVYRNDKYEETEAQSLAYISTATNAITDRFSEVLGIIINTNEPTYYCSPIDQCKGTVTKNNIDSTCNHEGTNHTQPSNVINAFKSAYPQQSNTTNIYWSMHKISTNRSCSADYTIALISRTQNLETTLMHEMSHQIGAPDHYHEGVYNDGSSCINYPICFECGYNARNEHCLMGYASLVDIMSETVYCDECIGDMLTFLLRRKS